MKQIKYVTILPQDNERFELVEMMRQIEPEAGHSHFRNIVDFMKDVKADSSLLQSIQGLYVKLDQNLPDILKLMRDVHGQNQKIYIIVIAAIMEMQVLSSLIQNGVSQVLMWPYSQHDLKNKMKSAALFQENVISEQNKVPKGGELSVWYESFTKNAYAVSLNGWLNTKNSLPTIVPEEKNAVLFVDWEGLRGISSVGIRLWMLWVKQLKLDGFSQFVFQNMHSVMLGLVGLVNEIMPENSKVNSFYMIYYNEDFDIEREFKFIYGEHFNDEQMQIPSRIETEHDEQKIVFTLDQNMKALTFYKGKLSRLEYVVSR